MNPFFRSIKRYTSNHKIAIRNTVIKPGSNSPINTKYASVIIDIIHKSGPVTRLSVPVGMSLKRIENKIIPIAPVITSFSMIEYNNKINIIIFCGLIIFRAAIK